MSSCLSILYGSLFAIIDSETNYTRVYRRRSNFRNDIYPTNEENRGRCTSCFGFRIVASDAPFVSTDFNRAIISIESNLRDSWEIKILGAQRSASIAERKAFFYPTTYFQQRAEYVCQCLAACFGSACSLNEFLRELDAVSRSIRM